MIVYIQGGFLICFIFSLLVKFGPSVPSSGTHYSVIRFLFIWSSGFGLMDPPQKGGGEEPFSVQVRTIKF